MAEEPGDTEDSGLPIYNWRVESDQVGISVTMHKKGDIVQMTELDIQPYIANGFEFTKLEEVESDDAPDEF